MNRLLRLLLAGALIGVPLAAMAQDRAPHLRARAVSDLPRPLPAPYDPRRDAHAEVNAALNRARQSGKPVLIDFGANWCADCRVLAGVFELPELRGWIAGGFELVQVDVGRFDRNLDIAVRFGVQLDAIPAVLVIDPATGRLRNRGAVLALSDATIMTPQTIANRLARWAK